MSVPRVLRRRSAFLALVLGVSLQALSGTAPADPPLPSTDPGESVPSSRRAEPVAESGLDSEALRKLEKRAEKERARQDKEMRKAAERERKRLEKERHEREAELRNHPQLPVRVAIPVRPQAPPRVLAAIWSQIVASQKITSLVIHVRQQKLFVYQGKKLAAIAPICTGNATHPTPMGRFTVIQKDRNHLSSRYGCFVDNATGRIVDGNAVIGQPPPPGTHYEAAEMPHFLRITSDGVGLHGGYLPGFAASHGCIRLPKSFASEIFELVQDGTPVSVIE